MGLLAGCAIVTAEKAALYTDGRYFAQAAEELDGNWQLMRDGLPETPTQVKWLRQVPRCPAAPLGNQHIRRHASPAIG